MLDFNVNKIFDVNADTFNEVALELFYFQYHNNTIYNAFVNSFNKDVNKIKEIKDIPFLPIQFFKTKKVCTTNFEAKKIFSSSGTTGMKQSKHFVKDISIYEKSFLKTFEQFYGNASNYCIIGLLPSYLERNDSSLIYMVNDLIKKSNHQLSNFYLNEYEQLYNVLKQLEMDKQPTILFGVTFALLDFAAQYNLELKYTTIVETGGMKGRGKELTRQDLHKTLQTKLQTKNIESEYGMTELLSQAYTKKDGFFYTPNWLKAFVRNEDDPLTIKNIGNGILNIIDLANVYSCAFIATDDIAKVYENGSFEILGRMDNSDMRGCSLLTI